MKKKIKKGKTLIDKFRGKMKVNKKSGRSIFYYYGTKIQFS